jgi:hypothetical protein
MAIGRERLYPTIAFIFELSPGHPGESRDPSIHARDVEGWAPAFAGTPPVKSAENLKLQLRQ